MKRFVSKILGILMCMLLLFLIGCSSVKPGYLKDAESGFKGIDSDPMFSLDEFNDFTNSVSTEDIIMINNKYPLYEAIYNVYLDNLSHIYLNIISLEVLSVAPYNFHIPL